MRRFSTEDRDNCVEAFADVVVLPLNGVAAGEFLIGGGLDFLEGNDEGLLLREAMANVGVLVLLFFPRARASRVSGLASRQSHFPAGRRKPHPGRARSLDGRDVRPGLNAFALSALRLGKIPPLS